MGSEPHYGTVIWLCKRFDIYPDGTVSKTSAVSLPLGIAVQHHVSTHDDLAKLLNEIGDDPHAAVINASFPDIPIGEEFVILSEREVEERLGIPSSDRAGQKGVHQIEYAGSKDAVKEAFRAGLPLRVGWSLAFDNDGKVDRAHWSDAGFLTEFEGEIFAQIADIQRQAPRRGTASVTMPAKPARWTGLAGTTGVLESHFDDGTATQPARVRTEWCIDSRAACALPSWRLVFLHDTSGTPLEGSRSALFDAVRSGYPIRFAWGASVGRGDDATSVEHAAEPVCISIMNGSELFVQLPEHIAQASYHDPANAAFDKPAVLWRGMMGTNGSFDAVMVDRGSGEEVWRMPQRARIAWFAYAPELLCTAEPTKLAVPGGVQRDERKR